MVPQLETDFRWGQFWTGLSNPNNEYCENSACFNKLKWDSDGSYLNAWEDQTHGIRADNGHGCLRYTSDRINDMICAMTYYYICEFKCPSTTTITTTTTTSTTTTITTTTTSSTLTTTTAGISRTL